MKNYLFAVLTAFCNVLVFSQATLPTYCTDFLSLPSGWTTNCTNTQKTHDDCDGKALTFNNGTPQRLTINYATAATTLKYSLSRNGSQNKTIVVEQSVNGAAWTTIATWTQANTPTIATVQTHALNSASRYVRFSMTVRVGGRMELDIVQVYNGTPHASAANCKLLPLNCVNAIPICSDNTFDGNSGDFGAQEVGGATGGCLSGENQSSWYYFQPLSSGNFQFTLTPAAGSDYDFAMWNGSCASLGSPIRCSYAGEDEPTGLQIGDGQDSEGALGDGFVNDLPITAGQTYIILIDNFSEDLNPFNFDITLTGGATLDCTPTPLPIELLSFSGEVKNRINMLYWTTYSENNNDYFILERTIDGIDWEVVNKQPGAGTSSGALDYTYEDENFIKDAINYYRLSQTDFDGEREVFNTISLDNTGRKNGITGVYNLMGQKLSLDAEGIVIVVYGDGTSELIAK